jgi:hypothetical protein
MSGACGRPFACGVRRRRHGWSEMLIVGDRGSFTD